MKVAVLVDLYLSTTSGGHVKYWQRISESISEFANKKFDKLKVTIFFLGKKKNTKKINNFVSYQTIKPIFPSSYLKFIGIDADSTDLFFFNPSLLFKLKKYDLIHTTDQFFAMTKTGFIASRLWNIPLTTSIHTDTPPYTKYYVKKILRNFSFFGVDKLLVEKWRIPDIYEKKMFKKIYNYIRGTEHAFVADKIYSPEILIKRTKNKNITKLNRGINNKIFKIIKENKKKFHNKYNIPKKDKVLFFSGRIHELKGAILLSKIHKELNTYGMPTTTLMAGEDIHGDSCKKIGGKKLKLIGYLNQKELASIYRCCDLFVFPSNFEIGPNVVLEAKSCGAVCVVSPDGGGKRIHSSGYDGIVVQENDTNIWTKKILNLLKNQKKIRTIKNNLKTKINIRSWEEIFECEIFFYWTKIIEKKS